MMKDNIVRNDILDNIDDCYIDKPEKDEKLPQTDHWARQQALLEKSKRRRFMSRRTSAKSLPESEDARKFAYQIYDLDETNSMNGGELFLFFKFAYFFKQLTQSNIHLIYQRNIDFDLHAQLADFEMGLFKEEFYEFEELQRWLRDNNKQDFGLNYLEFASWFQVNYHFIH